METVIETLVVILIACVFGFFGFRVLKHGGLSGALYGSKVLSELAEVDLESSSSLASSRVRILQLEDGRIAVEQVSKAPLGASKNGFALTQVQASELAKALSAAGATRGDA